MTDAAGTLTLPDFLLARIAEDEQAHRDVLGWPDGVRRLPSAHHERMLRGCESKRLIIEDHREADRGYCRRCVGVDEVDIGGQFPRYERLSLELPCPTLRALALPYADHPDYRDEWRP